jgi:hypothetical protein
MISCFIAILWKPHSNLDGLLPKLLFAGSETFLKSCTLFLTEGLGLKCSARIDIKKQTAATMMIEAPEVRLKW